MLRYKVAAQASQNNWKIVYHYGTSSTTKYTQPSQSHTAKSIKLGRALTSIRLVSMHTPGLLDARLFWILWKCSSPSSNHYSISYSSKWKILQTRGIMWCFWTALEQRASERAQRKIWPSGSTVLKSRRLFSPLLLLLWSILFQGTNKYMWWDMNKLMREITQIYSRFCLYTHKQNISLIITCFFFFR